MLNSSVLQLNRQDTTSWTINDDYDENFDRYNGTFKLYATKDFDSYKAGDELPQISSKLKIRKARSYLLLKKRS
ncbi:LPXTG cell wall anchor domain-containing protein [Enterococcus wangshanyuanii]|uniref:LPXTG cell wall anchor domain-containing protein n=1 Tax=Enterococcus wangshanyuanii TaxID=2005703 RepID=UPI000B4BCC4E|nr:LPXTG cell wall anchor domain-containing protein [Enterococcus wangshanyuanii]